MRIKIKKYKGNTQIYMAALILYIFADVFLYKSQIGYRVPTTVLLMMYWLVDALLIIKLLSSLVGYGRHENLKIIGILALIVITGEITKDQNYVCMLLLICSGYDVDFDEIIKVMAISIIFSITVVLVLYNIGIIGESISYRINETRHSVGFKYMGSLDDLFRHSMIIILYLNLKKSKPSRAKNSFILVSIFAVGSYAIYKLSLSRTNMYISEVFCILYLLFCVRKGGYKREVRLWLKVKEVFAIICIPICAIVSCVLPKYLYNSSILLGINSMLTGRVALANNALKTYDYKLFGQNVTWIGSESVARGTYTMADYNYVDNGYIQVGLQYGIIVLVIICIAYSYLFYSMVKEHNTFMCIWIALMGIENLINPTLLRFTSNAVTLFAVQFYVMKGRNYSRKRIYKFEMNNLEK